MVHKTKFFGKDFYPKTAAHEAGHLLGAEDKYYELKNANGERYTPPKEGYENNLMASLNGVVEERIIEEIIQSPKNKVKYAEKE